MIQEGKLYFKKTDRYFSEIVTDVAISGPTPDEMYHVTFISDRIELKSQTSVPKVGEDGVFELSYTADDNEFNRVALGLCSMTSKAYFGLFTAIIKRAKTQGTVGKLRDILAFQEIISDIELKDREDDKG